MAKATHPPSKAKTRARKPAGKGHSKPAMVQRPKRPTIDVAHWGTPSEGATRFALRQLLPGGPSRKCGLPGASGVIDYHWSLDRFSTDWVRQHFGQGRYQAEWLGPRPHPKSGRITIGSLGKSKQVDILAHDGSALRAQPSSAVARYGYPSHEIQPAPVPPAVRSEEEIDRRVAVERELGELRIKHEREMAKARQELEAERVKLDIRAEVEKLRREFDAGDDDSSDDDVPQSPWAPVATMVVDLLKDLVPVVKQLALGGATKGKAA